MRRATNIVNAIVSTATREPGLGASRLFTIHIHGVYMMRYVLPITALFLSVSASFSTTFCLCTAMSSFVFSCSLLSENPVMKEWDVNLYWPWISENILFGIATIYKYQKFIDNTKSHWPPPQICIPSLATACYQYFYLTVIKICCLCNYRAKLFCALHSFQMKAIWNRTSLLLFQCADFNIQA